LSNYSRAGKFLNLNSNCHITSKQFHSPVTLMELWGRQGRLQVLWCGGESAEFYSVSGSIPASLIRVWWSIEIVVYAHPQNVRFSISSPAQLSKPHFQQAVKALSGITYLPASWPYQNRTVALLFHTWPMPALEFSNLARSATSETIYIYIYIYMYVCMYKLNNQYTVDR
jgi:hypothetical protein